MCNAFGTIKWKLDEEKEGFEHIGMSRQKTINRKKFY